MKTTEYKYILILMLTMIFLSYGAFAATPEFGTAAQSKYAREFSVPKGKAVIYIYQLNEDGRGVSPQIKLNNYIIGRLAPGSFTVWTLAPGQLLLQVDGVKSATYSIRSNAGRIYLFRLSVKETSAGPEAELSLMSRSSRSDLAAIRLLKNPRTLTELAVSKSASVSSKSSSKEAPTDPESESQSDSDSSVTPGGIGLMLKTGVYTLSEDTQFIVGADRSFDESVSTPLSVEVYYQYDSGLTLGGELLSFTANFTTVGMSDTHDVDVLMLMGNVKKYYRNWSSFQPYIGAGIGLVTTDISGPTVTGDASGLAYQAMGGFEYRINNVGFFGEVKFINAEAEDSTSEKIDVSGLGLFAGVVFHF